MKLRKRSSNGGWPKQPQQSQQSQKPLREGEYPSKTLAETADGESVVISTTKQLPKSQRPVAPIKDRLLSEFLHNLFDGLNFKGHTGQAALIHLCRASAWRYPALKSFIYAWEDLQQPNYYRELYPDAESLNPTLEQACDVAKITPEDFIGELYKAIYYYGGESTRVQIQLGMDKVVQASLDSAAVIGKDGFHDRKLLFEATKLVETGPAVVNNINNQLNSVTQLNGLPKWEDSDKILMSALQAPRALPAATDAQTVEAQTVEAEIEQPVEAQK